MADTTKEVTITLPSGLVATVRKPTGGDRLNGERIAMTLSSGGDAGPLMRAYAVIASVTKIDGQPIQIEKLMGMYAEDIDAIYDGCPAGFFSLHRSQPLSSLPSTGSESKS